MDNEVWKTYPEFDWIEVSPFGEVRTVDKVVPTKRGTYFVKGRICKQYRSNKGYLYVAFGVKGKTVHRSVHRLVAETFVPNPDNLSEVNHKDNDRTNNNVNNLEWCTHEYNIQYKERYGTSSEESLGRPVIAIDLATLEISRFQSQREASRILGVGYQHINAVIKGRQKTTGGYWFAYADENAVESTIAKFGNEVADKIEQLVKDKELQPA